MPPLPDHHTIGMPPGTRCLRIVRQDNGWLVWLATRDYAHGTYLLLHDSGSVHRVVARVDEGDEITLVRPADRYICKRGEENRE